MDVFSKCKTLRYCPDLLGSSPGYRTNPLGVPPGCRPDLLGVPPGCRPDPLGDIVPKPLPRFAALADSFTHPR